MTGYATFESEIGRVENTNKAKEMRKELNKQGINATDDYMRKILYIDNKVKNDSVTTNVKQRY